MTTDDENLNQPGDEAHDDAAAGDEAGNENPDDAAGADDQGADDAAGNENGDDGKGDGDDAAADPKDAEIARLKRELATTNGRVGTEAGTRKLLAKAIKTLEEQEGVVDRDALAGQLGMPRERLDGILDSPEAADDQGELQRRAGIANTQLKSVSKLLAKNGQDAEKISASYVTLLKHDPEEYQRFLNTPEDELGSYVVERVTEAGDKVSDLVEAKGDIFAVLTGKNDRIAALEAENAALKAGKKPVVPKQTRVPLQNGSTQPRAAPAAAAETSAIKTVLG